MTKRLIRIAPLQTAKVLAAIYFVVSIPVALLMAVPMVFGAGNLNPVLGIGMLVAMPFLYALVGFLFTLLGAWVYNLVAAQTGGIEYTSVTATGD